ncbi:uncharacterized protein [Diadema antillarum]|uniref:uncharacterized protein n=1 Tax=Diadema antillarum TaxID=105358 RepID=UPI003A8748FF
MAGGGSLLDLCLAEAQLGQYSASFQARGVRDLEALASISMQEYTSYGVTPAEDKKQLFRLIHTLRNLDLNKLSDMKSDNTPRLDDVENCEVPDSSQGDISHLENKKAVKNHHNKAFQSSRNLPVVNSPSERGEEKREHPRMLKDTPRNSVLNRTFDMDDDSDKEKSEQSDVEVNAYNQDEGDGGNHGDDADAEVHIVEHERTGYNYGVPSASPATQSRLKLAAKSTPSNASRAGGTGFEERIRVCVRKRPMSRKEWKGGEGEAVTTEGQTTVLVKERKLAVDLTKVIQVHKYHFDEVFHEACSNEEVYERTAKPLVSAIFNKCNATCFAYGQTGAGKTHTLLGGHGKVKGLYLLAAEDIFRAIRSSLEGAVLVVYISYFEIYCGQLYDLLNNRERLHARENAHHKVCITGLNEVRVNGPQSLIQVVESGNSVRVVGVSGVNADSSRSHAILQIQLKDKAGNPVSKFSFIDLAGSERACDMSDPDKITRQEGAEINTSLLALKECIRALDQEKRHTPFRQSKLTQVLRDSFLGQSRTCMIACVSPNASAVDHTLNTLRYADRVKKLRQEGGFGGSPSPTIQTFSVVTPKHPPTPSNFSPSNTSTPFKTRKSKQETSPPTQGASPKTRREQSRRTSSTTAASGTKAVGENRANIRRKSAPDTSPTKVESSPVVGNALNKKSASHHNLKNTSLVSGQGKVEKKKGSGADIVQRLKLDDSLELSKSKSSGKRKVIQSGAKFRENRALEERRMRSAANRSRLEQVAQSTRDETPSKRTPEARERMKKAFLNSSLPVWGADQNGSNREAALPQAVPRPQKLEFENPRYLESPSRERPVEDKTKAEQERQDMESNVPYRFDIPNPRYYKSPRQKSQDEHESGYIPDDDTEIHTPVSSGRVVSRTHKRYTADEASRSSQNGESIREREKRERTSSSDCPAGSRSSSSSTTELLAEIERSLQRSPVPLSPRPGSEPWMRVISEDKFHRDEPPLQGIDEPQKNARKELFGASSLQNPQMSPSAFDLSAVAGASCVQQTETGASASSPISAANLGLNHIQENHGGSDHGILGPANAMSSHGKSHILKEKFHHSGFSLNGQHGTTPPFVNQELPGDSPGWQSRRVTDGQELVIKSSPKPTRVVQASSNSAECLSLDRPVPVGQQYPGLPSAEQVNASEPRGFVPQAGSSGSAYFTPTQSNSRQNVAVSSTPKAFKHESLGMDSSLMHLSFSTIQSPTKPDQPTKNLPLSAAQSPSKPDQTSTSKPSESFATAVSEDMDCEEVVLPVSPRMTLWKSKSDGNLLQSSPGNIAPEGQLNGSMDSLLQPSPRPVYQRQHSAAERARKESEQSCHSSTPHQNNNESTRELLLAAHSDQLEETLRLCETGWALIGQLKTNQMDLSTYMSEVANLLDSQAWCIDTLRDQLNSFSRCASPSK